MKTWKVLATEDVQADLDNFVYYLLVEKLNEQAAAALLNDYDDTIEELKNVAGSLKDLQDPDLQEYKKIRLRYHNYFLLYRLDGNVAVVERMFHDLQDLDKALK
ncbi:MAG: type II toxin-antitoxin system RelE/ParE family toxin [Lachnospiraceae bacterium]|nr:type II toxin-antitoxin system RelE/ParE family toxin [Lachnospiraceae bacterium]